MAWVVLPFEDDAAVDVQDPSGGPLSFERLAQLLWVAERGVRADLARGAVVAAAAALDAFSRSLLGLG